jgi:hypothetical protein
VMQLGSLITRLTCSLSFGEFESGRIARLTAAAKG